MAAVVSPVFFSSAIASEPEEIHCAIPFSEFDKTLIDPENLSRCRADIGYLDNPGEQYLTNTRSRYRFELPTSTGTLFEKRFKGLYRVVSPLKESVKGSKWYVDVGDHDTQLVWQLNY